MNEKEHNRQQMYNMIRDRKRRLSETDRRSLIRAIGGLTDFGNDFAIYRAKFLSDVPNTVITGLCYIMKELGFPVYLPREADRYNEISTLCIQETWNACLKHIFQLTKFINVSQLKLPLLNEIIPLPDIYNHAIDSVDNDTPYAQIASYIRQRESAIVTHIVIVRSKILTIVATFEKRGSAHKLLAYAVRKGDQEAFIDTRNKQFDKSRSRSQQNHKLPITIESLQDFINLTQNTNYSAEPMVQSIPQVPSRHHTYSPPQVQPIIPSQLPTNDLISESFQPFVVPTKKTITPLPSIIDLIPFHTGSSILTPIFQFSTP